MIRSALSTLLRGLLVAALAGIAAFGVLVVFQPFAPRQAPAPVVETAARETLRQEIESLRAGLRATELSLENVNPAPAPSSPADGELRARLDAQIVTADERRDLALRHAAAIRDGLAAGVDISSLAGMRDSAIVGQLLAQRTALDITIAEQGARLRAAHPAMLALQAQRSALSRQIEAEAASIAAALDSEAQQDAAQIALLREQMPPAASSAPTAPTPDASGLSARRAEQQAQLEALMDAYFGVVPAATQAAQNSANPFGAANLLVILIAASATMLFHLALAWRRGRRRHADIAQWETDQDPAAPDAPFEHAAEPELRQAS